MVTTVRSLKILLLSPLLALGLAGCSGGGTSPDDPNVWYNKTMAEYMTGRPANSTEYPANRANPSYTPYSATSPPPSGALQQSGAPGAVPATELYRGDGGCGGMLLGPGASGGAVSPGQASGISLEMTECEVANRAGPPDKVAIAVAERGERALTLSYLHVQHPRIYHFVAGRLVSVENLPPPVVAKRQKS